MPKPIFAQTLNAILIVTTATCAAGRAAGAINESTLSIEGMQLTAEQVPALEQKISKDPSDWADRTRLLGYYFTRQYGDPAVSTARLVHIQWLITNRPASESAGAAFAQVDPVISPEGYVTAKHAWLEQTVAHPKDAAVLGNAAAFLQQHDPADAEKLLIQAQAIEPEEPKWPTRLGQFYKIRQIPAPPADRKELAAKSLSAMEKAAALTKDPTSKFYLFDDLAESALAAGDSKKAAGYAHQSLDAAATLRNDWNYGNAIYTGHSILGQIALANNDLATAKSELLESAKTPGSPQLDSFGPNLSLAHDLLAKGERDAVLQYLELVGKFWRMGGGKLKSWSDQIRSGQQPDLRRF